MQCPGPAAQEEREQQITSFRPGDKREASLKLDGKTSSTGATMEEDAVVIAATIQKNWWRQMPTGEDFVRASNDNGDAGYGGVAFGNRGADDGRQVPQRRRGEGCGRR
ncbi:hypothetical protein AAHE18_02G156000 [Arachis hypogaea]